MSLSSPYGQSGGSSDQSPLGGPSVFGTAQNNSANSPTFQPLTQLWNQYQGGQTMPQMGGALTPSPTQQPAPQTSLNGVQSGSAVAPPGVTSPTNNIQPVMGAAQAPVGVTGGATDPTTMMVNALAQPTPPLANPASFAPQNSVSAAPAAPQAPANPLSFLGATAPAVPAAAPTQPQNPYGF